PRRPPPPAAAPAGGARRRRSPGGGPPMSIAIAPRPPQPPARRLTTAARSAFTTVPPSVLLSFIVVLIVILWSLFPALFTSYSAVTANPAEKFLGPGAQHWFGTDDLGRDEFARVVYGARSSVGTALVAVAIGLFAGGLIGLLAGFTRGSVDAVPGAAGRHPAGDPRVPAGGGGRHRARLHHAQRRDRDRHIVGRDLRPADARGDAEGPALGLRRVLLPAGRLAQLRAVPARAAEPLPLGRGAGGAAARQRHHRDRRARAPRLRLAAARLRLGGPGRGPPERRDRAP